jgi:hypothetical protein
MFKVIKEGHIYELTNRSENGFIDGSVQTMTFIEVKDDAVNSVGLFTQDYMNALINRIEFLIEFSAHINPDVQMARKNSLFYLQKSLDAWDKSTDIRIQDGDRLLGHVKNENEK